MNDDEARKKINELTAEALAKLREAEVLATAHDITFDFSPAYGMGGWYESGEWRSSSQSC